MARQWECTPGTISRAYRALGRDGLLVGQPGKGTIVAPSPIQTGPDAGGWGWPALINRAENFLLESLKLGHTPAEVETAVSVAASRVQSLQASKVASTPSQSRAKRGPLRFVGSHDLLMDLIVRFLQEGDRSFELTVEFAGSLGGLIALSRGAADLAGVHLWDEATGSYNLPFIERVLPGKRLVVLTLAHRQLGMFVAPGNPLNIHTLDDLARANVRFVNRQPGSGTRVWLDAQLRGLGIETKNISGYDQEEQTHLAVADAVALGKVDVGLGILAAGRSVALDFVPLTRERYDLVIPRSIWRLPSTKALVAVVNSVKLKESIRFLGGYDDAETGRETRLPRRG
jgi:molybdate-binding protein